MRLSGNALAANGGTLTLDLGNGGVWRGRADDYKDAENEAWRRAHTDIFAPQFSNGIQLNGSVNVDLGSGSYWNVTGQSWVSKLEGNGTIDLRGEDTGGYAIHIGELTGSNTFYLNLYNGDKIGDGDMIYIAKEVSAPQKIVIANRDEVLSSMKAGRPHTLCDYRRRSQFQRRFRSCGLRRGFRPEDENQRRGHDERQFRNRLSQLRPPGQRQR